MDTRLVRLKAVDRRRGNVLRRFTHGGISFVAGAGWYRVSKKLAEHLAEVRQIDGDAQSPLAFEVCSDAEARLVDEAEARDANAVKRATDRLPLNTGRGEAAGAVTTAELLEPDGEPAPASEERGRRSRRERE